MVGGREGGREGVASSARVTGTLTVHRGPVTGPASPQFGKRTPTFTKQAPRESAPESPSGLRWVGVAHTYMHTHTHPGSGPFCELSCSPCPAGWPCHGLLSSHRRPETSQAPSQTPASPAKTRGPDPTCRTTPLAPRPVRRQKLSLGQ